MWSWRLISPADKFGNFPAVIGVQPGTNRNSPDDVVKFIWLYRMASPWRIKTHRKLFRVHEDWRANATTDAKFTIKLRIARNLHPAVLVPDHRKTIFDAPFLKNVESIRQKTMRRPHEQKTVFVSI